MAILGNWKMDVDVDNCHGTATQEGDHNMLLKQLLEHTAQMAHRINELSQAVTAMKQGGAV